MAMTVALIAAVVVALKMAVGMGLIVAAVTRVSVAPGTGSDFACSTSTCALWSRTVKK